MNRNSTLGVFLKAMLAAVCGMGVIISIVVIGETWKISQPLMVPAVLFSILGIAILLFGTKAEDLKERLAGIGLMAFFQYSLLGMVIIGIIPLDLFSWIMIILCWLLLLPVLFMGIGREGIEERIEHYDESGRYTGYSIRRGNKIIHYNKEGRYIGESKEERPPGRT